MLGKPPHGIHYFSYRDEGTPPIARPTLDIQLQYEDHPSWSTRALVDTGSPITLFDRGTADGLGIRVGNTGARHESVRIMGGSYRAQFELVSLSLPEAPGESWEASIGFIMSPTFQMPFQGLLGTDGFLDRFVVTFNKYEEWFSLQHYNDWHE